MKDDSKITQQNEGVYLSTLSEITNQKLFFEALITNIPIAVVTLDENDMITSCNPAFEELFGHKLHDILGESLDDLINSEHTRVEAREYTKAVQKGDTLRAIGLRKCADGSEVEVEIYGVPVLLNGVQIGSLAIYTNLTERRKGEQQLRESLEKLQVLATIDMLTGILNRRAISEQIKKEANRAERENKSIGLMLIDLDNLKSINDHFGHLAGDAGLQKVASIITAQSRVYDHVGRWGGDEFMLSLVNVSKDEVMVIAERILQAARNADLVFGGKQIPLSVSIGVTCFTPGEKRTSSMDHIFSIADEALYQAKAAGRDQAVAIPSDKTS